MPTSKRPRTLAEMYRAAAETAWERFNEHSREHRCEGWHVSNREGGGLRFDFTLQCPLRRLLKEQWVALDGVAELPSPDARLYADWPIEGSAET